jgi:hypothetical protein
MTVSQPHTDKSTASTLTYFLGLLPTEENTPLIDHLFSISDPLRERCAVVTTPSTFADARAIVSGAPPSWADLADRSPSTVPSASEEPQDFRHLDVAAFAAERLSDSVAVITRRLFALTHPPKKSLKAVAFAEGNVVPEELLGL